MGKTLLNTAKRQTAALFLAITKANMLLSLRFPASSSFLPMYSYKPALQTLNTDQTPTKSTIYPPFRPYKYVNPLHYVHHKVLVAAIRHFLTIATGVPGLADCAMLQLAYISPFLSIASNTGSRFRCFSETWLSPQVALLSQAPVLRNCLHFLARMSPLSGFALNSQRPWAKVQAGPNSQCPAAQLRHSSVLYLRMKSGSLS